jgi:hypothetical protein
MTFVKKWWNNARFDFWNARPYSRWDVRRQAEIDGRLDPPVPSPNDKIAPWYIGAMKENFDNIVRGILGKFQSEDEAHRLRITERERAKKEASENLKRAGKVYDDACAYFKQFYPDIPPNSVKRRVIGYWAITAFLFLLEFPMNFTAFKLFGDHANILTAATAAAIGGALLVLAHYTGIAWEKGPMKNRKAMIDIVVLVSLAILAIYSVAQLRTAYLANNPDVTFHDSSILLRSFAVFNLMLFGCAAFISRHRHMTGLDLVHFAQDGLTRCRRRFHALERELSIEKQKRESLRVTSETDAHRVTDQHLEMAKLYLMYNRRVRVVMEGDGLLCPPFLAADGVNTSSLVSLPPHFAERIPDEPAAPGGAEEPVSAPDGPSGNEEETIDRETETTAGGEAEEPVSAPDGTAGIEQEGEEGLSQAAGGNQ